MTETKQILPKWFKGEVYQHGDIVENRFGGDSIKLNAIELSMYDFIIGASMLIEMDIAPSSVDNLREGLSWFRKNNAEAYMILLD
jgi:hypothetical protein|tara:strand:- start:1441 stop:1695 length:255 start_codon:yes stop_codon:yes gene_type:complete